MNIPSGIRRRLLRPALGATLLLAGAGVPASAQPLQNRLLRFSAMVDGTPEAGLRWPVDVAAGSADEVAVADVWKNRVVVFRRAGASWSQLREVGLPAPPSAVAFQGGRYVVGLRGDSKLVLFEGGAATAAPGAIDLPEGILAGRIASSSDGALLLWDSRQSRIVKLREGAVVLRVPMAHTVTALASDGAGGFWAGIGETGELARYDAAGKPIVTWRLPADGPVPAWPSGLAVEPAGRLFALDRHGDRVVVLDATGRAIGLGAGRGWEPGQLMFPAGLVRLPNGGLFVGDGGNGRAQVFDVVGAGAN